MKVVHYRKQSLLQPPEVGNCVFLQTLDHPSPQVTNWPQSESYVRTSRVVEIDDKEGCFMTENTVYVPKDV